MTSIIRIFIHLAIDYYFTIANLFVFRCRKQYGWFTSNIYGILHVYNFLVTFHLTCAGMFLHVCV